jgi:cytochrome P450
VRSLDVVLDPETPGFFLRPDYFELLRALREESPVHRYAPASWVVSRYEDVRTISRDPGRFRSSGGVVINDPFRKGEPMVKSVIHMDPPEHGPHRGLVSRRFTPRATATMEQRLREIARALFDGVATGDEVDFVDDLASPFPVLVIAELLGVSDGNRDDFRRWSDAIIESPDGPTEHSMQMLGELFGFLGAHAKERRACPADDLTSLLVSGEVAGRCLATEDVLSYMMTLLVAGNETTRHLISGGAEALAEHPEQRALLAAEPDRIPGAVEELLRWVTPIQAMGRTATEDLELGGEAVAEGDFLIMLYASANRDEAAFGPDAGTLDVTRPVQPTHLAFGFGEHLCLGASLARLEARIFFEELLDRFPNYEVAGEPTYTASTLVRGASSLPMVLR